MLKTLDTRMPSTPARGRRSHLTRAVAERIFLETGDLEEVITFMARVMRGLPMPTDLGEGDDTIPLPAQIPTLDQRIGAAEWLAERAIGKAPQTIELEGPAEAVELDVRKLSTEELIQFRDMLARTSTTVQ